MAINADKLFDRGSHSQLNVAGSILSNSFKRNCIGIERDTYRSSLTSYRLLIQCSGFV